MSVLVSGYTTYYYCLPFCSFSAMFTIFIKDPEKLLDVTLIPSFIPISFFTSIFGVNGNSSSSSSLLLPSPYLLILSLSGDPLLDSELRT